MSSPLPSLELADLYVPDALDEASALARTTHLGIGAHQDDLEFMALHGILAGYDSAERWFGGVTCTDGAGSARSGPFAGCTDAELRELRLEEQREAARIGQYSFILQTAHPSATVKSPAGREILAQELTRVLLQARPAVVYTHNPADRHPTHVAVFLAALEALRRLPVDARPREVWGCEGWRDLDWLDDRTALDVSAHPELAARLNAIFVTQIAGGKRYDLAVEGRQRANATFGNSHTVDRATKVTLAMNLLPLINDPALSPLDFTVQHITDFAAAVRKTFQDLR